MSIILEHLTKRYEGYPVVNHVSLEIADGEFFVLLGPSGSGKSTILRIIAGLTTADTGRVLLHGRDVLGLPPQQRGVGFVFQHYALFQHMTVADNVEFGLRIRRVARGERRRICEQLLDLVGLAGLGGRMPRQLSGGQQQRVALARALAYQPSVLLLDEPFGALDAKIRGELRASLRRTQREYGITTIFVTHDQEEAFELADRIGVMNVGRLLEVGQPAELYRHPQTEFVASFLGSANLLVGQATAEGVQLGPLHFSLGTAARDSSDMQRVQVLFRPEDVVLAPSAEALIGPALGVGEVEQVAFAGSLERLRMRVPPIAGVRPIAPLVAFGADAMLIDAARPQEQAQRMPLAPGDRVWLSVRRIHALIHPGLSFLIMSDGSAAAQAMVAAAGQIARMAHARTMVFSNAPAGDDLDGHLADIREQIGSSLPSLELRAIQGPAAEALLHELEQRPHDLVVLAAQPGASEIAGQLLQLGEHHLLLMPASQQVPARVLICVAAGEPGKDDVRFAGRLVRHLGADVTLMTVLAPSQRDDAARQRAERFLSAGMRTLALLGLEAQTVIRAGNVREEIERELAEGQHDMLVLGVPLARPGRRAALSGVVGELVGGHQNCPILLVRSREAIVRAKRMASATRARIDEEVLR
jgi:sulfate transport system ATP-binding protein